MPTLSPVTPEITAIKDAQRAAWTAGDYGKMAPNIEVVGERLLDRLEVGPGDRLLDVGCGVGGLAIRAAARGARVTGLDLTPKLLEAAERGAREAGVEVEWVLGDAEDLPFADGAFDVVTSTFACMFAPRHAVAARELARVLAAGGRLGVCAWTPEGPIGDFFATVGRHVPPPPGMTHSPLLWGDERHVRELFEGLGVEAAFVRDAVELTAGSVEEDVQTYERDFGPVVRARARLEAEGRWQALRDDIAALLTRWNTATDGTLRYAGEHLVTLARKPV